MVVSMVVDKHEHGLLEAETLLLVEVLLWLEVVEEMIHLDELGELLVAVDGIVQISVDLQNTSDASFHMYIALLTCLSCIAHILDLQPNHLRLKLLSIFL